MITIYGIKNCNSMKKAFTLLDELGVSYQFHDYKKSGIDAATLDSWLKQISLDTLINRKGTTWRGLSADEQLLATTPAGAVQLMQQKSSVIKRPVITDGVGGVICGLDIEKIRSLA